MKKRLLVTGGLGFIGSNFINKCLRDNNFVINVDNQSKGSCLENVSIENKSENYVHKNIDINSNEILGLLRKYDVDCLVHFAAESHVDRSIESPKQFIKTNILGTFNLLEESIAYQQQTRKDFHFHHVSTDEVFGSLNMTDDLFKESNQYKPNSPYSASKAASDHLVRAWSKTFGLNMTISNCSNNYGPNQNPEKLIPKTIVCCLKGEEIPIYGNGENTRDWLYVDDHCNAIMKIILNAKRGSYYNIGGKNEITNINLVTTICDYLDSHFAKDAILPLSGRNKGIDSFNELIKYVKDRPGHDLRYAIDSSKIEHEIGWIPSETFETGIKKTINWYLDNINWLRENI
tara:strand:+ start:6745 stop:7782 length:1038 start_codon:yes stop_codon:yes gene_type:complete